MKASQFTLATLRNTPSDADIISAQLMIKAGLIRKLASGLYVWMPTGLRVLKRVEKIVREEMERISAQELLMPVTQPGDRVGFRNMLGRSYFSLNTAIAVIFGYDLPTK